MAKRRRVQKAKNDIDIVIPVYGRPDLLQKCLDSLHTGVLKASVFLVDDNGPEQDKLRPMYTSLNSYHRVLRNNENKGFAYTVNKGVKAGKAPLVLILNSDIELQPGAIEAMAAEFSDPKMGVVSCKLLFPEDSTDPTRPAGKVQHAGLAITAGMQITHANIGWSADHPKVNERREHQALTGACLMTSRKVFSEVHNLYRTNGDPTAGAFNEVYGKGTYEDVEYCFAARTLGYKVIYTPAGVGYHHVGGSVIAAGQGYPVQRNEMIFKARCGGMMVWDEWKYS